MLLHLQRQRPKVLKLDYSRDVKEIGKKHTPNLGEMRLISKSRK